MPATEMPAQVPVEYTDIDTYRHVLVEVDEDDNLATVVVSSRNDVLDLRLDAEQLDDLIESLIRARDVVAANI